MPFCEKHKRFYIGVCPECKKEKVGTLVASTPTTETGSIKVEVNLPLKISIEELEKSLKEQIEFLKSSKSEEEISRAKREVVVTLSELALRYAESNMGVHLLNTLNKLRQYVNNKHYLKELENATKYVDLMINESIPVSNDDFLNKLKILLNNIKEYI